MGDFRGPGEMWWPENGGGGRRVIVITVIVMGPMCPPEVMSLMPSTADYNLIWPEGL